MEKMIVTRALDERDLLIKKINDAIDRASFVAVKRHQMMSLSVVRRACRSLMTRRGRIFRV